MMTAGAPRADPAAELFRAERQLRSKVQNVRSTARLAARSGVLAQHGGHNARRSTASRGRKVTVDGADEVEQTNRTAPCRLDDDGIDRSSQA
jgi:hypothetical protein